MNHAWQVEILKEDSNEDGNHRDVWDQVPHYLWGDDVALQADARRGGFQRGGDGKPYRGKL
jgi:hypothetical protein